MKKPGFESLEKGDSVYRINYAKSCVDELKVTNTSYTHKAHHYDGHYDLKGEDVSICQYDYTFEYLDKEITNFEEKWSFCYNDEYRYKSGNYFMNYEDAQKSLADTIQRKIDNNKLQIAQLEETNEILSVQLSSCLPF